jgi:O-acetyl-ADP-ribose deacetylase (regulator of RNase III)
VPLQIEVRLADITRLDVDAIVNAANSALSGGGGVDGAIHRAAGWAQLAAACAALGGCEPGEAKATPGFALPARFIIHTVGPVWRGGVGAEAEVLASCYRRSLEVADELEARSVAFPSISTGAYGFPAELAARTAVAALRAANSEVRLVLLVDVHHKTLLHYEAALGGGRRPLRDSSGS